MCQTPIWLQKQRIYVPCGKCKACLMKSTYDWAHRIVIESQYHEKSCVLTLTYDDDHMPEFRLLEYYDVQCFLKRLRKRIGKIRYFVSGEYGTQFGRPHYHMIVFGYFPDDAQYMYRHGSNRFYKSDFVQSTWGKGIVSVGHLTPESAFYCAKYLQKLNFGSNPHPPFVHMSTHPGIGYQAYTDDMFNSKRLYVNGKPCALPRYYYKLMSRGMYGIVMDDPEYKARIAVSMRSMGNYDSRTQLSRAKSSERFKKKFSLKY